MSDDSFKNFLQENAAPMPSAPVGEEGRIWSYIDNRNSRSPWWWVIWGPTLAGVTLTFFLLKPINKTMFISEETYLYQEWESLVREVDTDVDQELNNLFAGE